MSTDVRWKVTFDDAQTGEPVEVTRIVGKNLTEGSAKIKAKRAEAFGAQNVVVWSKRPGGRWIRDQA